MEEESLGIVIGTVVSVEKVQGTARLHIVKIGIGKRILQVATGVPDDLEVGYLIGN